MTETISNMSAATKETMELVQSIQALSAQSGPTVKIFQNIADVFTWKNVPVTLGVCAAWAVLCLAPTTFIMFGPHAFVLWVLGVVLSKKIRKTKPTEAQFQADMQREMEEKAAAERAAAAAKKAAEEAEKAKRANWGYLQTGLNFATSSVFSVTKTAASFLPVDLPDIPNLGDVAKQIDGIQKTVDNGRLTDGLIRTTLLIDQSAATNQLATVNQFVHDLSWADEQKTYDLVEKILLSWVVWVIILYFIPFKFIALILGELGLFALSETGGLAIAKISRMAAGSAPAANGDAKKVE
ncbi:hypothetical protein DFJ74DRAFT_688724 [Hyaloraphidium curvatum]|nr:hypothetical protein DFJ74DRAFT_688724 [Hyaloraphidium curvatum]